MPVPQQIECIAPRLLGPVPGTLADALSDAGPFPQLEWLVAHARREPAAGVDTETLLASVHPSLPAPGPLVAAGQGLPLSGYGYRAAPVHLRPDRDRLLLFAGPEFEPLPEESTQLVDAFNHTFGADGLTLWSNGADWLLLVDEPPGPDLPALAQVAGYYLDTVLPDEVAFRRWRQLLNEMQMFLHDHPVNQQREARGEVAINGLWFWGGGPSAAPSELASDRVVGDDALSQGLATLGGTALEGVDTGLGADNGEITLIWTDAEAALVAGDAAGWMAAVERFETLIAPRLVKAAQAGSARINLYSGNSERLSLGPWAHWHFWCRRHPLSRRVTRRG